MCTTKIVLGLQYGDEGKGLMTAALCKKGDLVVRFNGGQQAGHTVIQNGHRHIFSSFGSGTLTGAHTYISEFCTFYPKSFYNERRNLIKHEFDPIHFIHPLAMVTTPFDIDHNRSTEEKQRHGSVGMGFGATIHRNENSPHKLYVVDLLNEEILNHKLWNIARWYGGDDIQKQIKEFMQYVTWIKNTLNICRLEDIVRQYDNIVFEGAQGIMLDMEFGYFPNVTRSYTTSRNALEIIKNMRILPDPEVHYAMRSYLTRHGNGPMPNESPALQFEDKTNQRHEYQGHFRQGYHSLKQLQHAIQCDSAYSGYDFSKKNLLITCLDQTEGMIYVDNKIVSMKELVHHLGPFKRLYTNNSPVVETIKKNSEYAKKMSSAGMYA